MIVCLSRSLIPVLLTAAGAILATCAASPVAHAAEPPPLLQLGPSSVPASPTRTGGVAFAQLQGTYWAVGGTDPSGQPLAQAFSFTPGRDTTWQKHAFAQPLAQTTLVATGDALVCLGGLGEGAAQITRVTLLQIKDGVLAERPLPPLPRWSSAASATFLGHELYYVGPGIARPGSGLSPRPEFLTLDLTQPAAGWQTLPPCPIASGLGGIKIVAQNGELFVFGRGNALARQFFAAGPGEAWAYRTRPLEGTAQIGWVSLSPLPPGPMLAQAQPFGPLNVLLFPQVAQGAARLLLYSVTTGQATTTRLILSGALAAAVPIGPGRFTLFYQDGTSGTLSALRAVRNLSPLDYMMIVGYFGCILQIGFWFARRQESSAEFALGSRKVKWWAAGISMFATGASAISFMSVPALAFATSLIWTTPLLVFLPAYFVQAYLIMPLLRRLEITSTFEYLERRFNTPLRLIACVQAILTQTVGRAAIILLLPSLAIAATTGISVFWSVVIMGFLTTIYTTVGGFEAVVWTEVFQGVLKLASLLLMIVLAIASLPGGWHEFWTTNQQLGKFTLVLPSNALNVPSFWLIALSSFLSATIVQAGDQPTIQRIFSSPMHEVRRVTAIFVVCSVLVGLIANTLGLALFAYFHAFPAQLDPLSKNDQIVPLFATQVLPHGITGIVVAAIFASAMATVASSMNSVATIFTEDIFLRLRPNAPDRTRLWVLRLVCALVGVFGTATALYLSTLNFTSALQVWTEILALTGGGIVGVFALGMFTRRANGPGAVAGAGASILLTFYASNFTSVHWMGLLPIAILSCLFVGYLASFAFQDRRDLTGLTVFTPREARS